MKKKVSRTKLPIKFYQSAIGMPFAIQGNKIASWLGKSGDEDFFGYMSVKKFEKNYFPVSKLRLVASGMPEKYIKGLSKELRAANR